jgi:hypothetical protein
MRVQYPKYESPIGADYGMFECSYKGQRLRMMSSGSTNGQWEYVSVSAPDRCPTWEEMCFVKDLFWSGSETVIQFHPKKSEYVNTHENCLHLWKRVGVDEKLPPQNFV